MSDLLIVIEAFVFAGMMLGGIPGLALDRTGVALLGAIALLGAGLVSPEAATAAVDMPTIALLFALMVMSAQLRLGGFYTAITRRLAAAPLGPRGLLGLVILVTAGLSALLANDIVCLAVTPLLIEGTVRRGWNPRPFLLGLAAAANVGSAATLIGNPQNMLIGQRLHVSFAGYLLDGGVPALLGLGVVWGILMLAYRGRWHAEGPPPNGDGRAFSTWQTTKGLVVIALVIGAFLGSRLPREVVALVGAGVLLLSRRMRSRELLGLVDWHLLVMFVALFIVNHALLASGLLGRLLAEARLFGLPLDEPPYMFGASVVLSNLVSNVPAVMLLLPTATHPMAAPVLALSSTLAGNLLVVGSIANILVIEQARTHGVAISTREHARVGVPVTLGTLAIAAGWLWLLAR